MDETESAVYPEAHFFFSCKPVTQTSDVLLIHNGVRHPHSKKQKQERRKG
jgi:hypothetical protein